MTAFRPISPEQALVIVANAGVVDPQRLIVDFAAAGLVKGCPHAAQRHLSIERNRLFASVVTSDPTDRREMGRSMACLSVGGHNPAGAWPTVEQSEVF